MKRETIARKQVLLAGGEPHVLTTCKLHLEVNGISDVLTVSDHSKVLPILDSGEVAVAVLDLGQPEGDGLELLARALRQDLKVIVTADDQIDTAVECLKLGAVDYLAKPVNHGRLVESVKRALEGEFPEAEAEEAQQAPGGEPRPRKGRVLDEQSRLAAFAELVTRNKKMKELFRYAEALAASRQPILILGETGSGKELVARAIHKLSGCKGEYVALNAAGLDDPMFSDALFGHQRGAYTGADQAREGLVARAAGGTLFLDEIGDLNELSQVKLLRLLQEEEYYPVGSDLVRKSHARILLATNRDLPKRISEGRFRQDLYYRLCSHQVRIPPLRERRDDLPLLLDHFIELMAERLGVEPPTYSKKLLELLEGYDFPGNVRELQGMVDDAVLRRKDGLISDQPFVRTINAPAPEEPPPAPREENNLEQLLTAVWGHFPTLREAEDLLINTALELAKGNQRIAAGMLGLNRQTLNMRLKSKRKATSEEPS
ncbi:sigma-54 dependent transcriptional regulator [Geomonas sp.]|uniref:sigma-54-dependent transcriptional regulator n=1 Tax=Geomonas sp. TaxID=2651584 RepID=UPI002B4950C2|nr:sigma-54 dependent transcriptional regulator [Geomonas sp.]HJV34629.1 sigma-54 dependent transcriptional regulator [Geomonas sp.]